MSSIRNFHIIALVVCLSGCGVGPTAPSGPQPCVAPVPNVPASVVDGAPLYPNSWHSAHVKVLSEDEFQLDDGSFIKLFLTGGTQPFRIPIGTKGILYVSVPDYGGNYYFQKFSPDHERKAGDTNERSD